MAATLIQGLGYRAPSPDEERLILSCDTSAAGESKRCNVIPAAVLNADPLISYSGIVPHAPLGLASLCGTTFVARHAWFLLSPTWTIEAGEVADALRSQAVRHRKANRHHRLIFICNTPEETAMMQHRGEAAFHYNKTANVLQSRFRPLYGARASYDAIYNAQLVPWKRHELSLDIERCAFLFYRDGSRADAHATQTAIMERHAAKPGHVFLNPLDENGRPLRLSARKVNRYLNKAAVGLCLSETEGAMFASTEYMLAGLPIVSTPSRGGRHVYFDAEFCWTVPADPSSIATAVYELRDRRISRSYIRNKTLRRLDADRERFLSLINAILEEGASDLRLDMPWPFEKPVTMEWLTPTEAVHRARHGIVDGFRRKTRWSWRRGWFKKLAP